jgi:hypothetical protein
MEWELLLLRRCSPEALLLGAAKLVVDVSLWMCVLGACFASFFALLVSYPIQSPCSILLLAATDLCAHRIMVPAYGKVTSLYMPLGGTWAETWKKPETKPKKVLEEIKGKGLGTQPQKQPHHIYLVGSKRSAIKLSYLHIEVGRPAGDAVWWG